MSEFRIVLQIEQLDDNGEPLCIYGPADPYIVVESDDAELMIDSFEQIRGTLRDEHISIGEY